MPFQFPTLQQINSATQPIFGGDPALSKAGAAGANLGALLFGNQGLGRVTEAIDPQLEELFFRLREESFLGGKQNTPAETNAIQQASTAANNAQLTNPLVAEAIQNARNLALGAGNISANQQGVIDASRSEYQNARNISPLLQEAVDAQRASLQGLQQPELLALRESLESSANRNLQSGIAQLQAGGLVNGGAAGTSTPITAQYADAQRGLQRDVLLAQQQAREAALNRFSDTAQTIDNNGFARAQAALSALSGNVQGIENELFNRQLNANNQFTNTLGSSIDRSGALATNAFNVANTLNTQNIADRTQRLQNFANFNQNLRNDILARQIFNLNQVAAEKAGLTTSIFDAAGFAAAQEGRKEANALAEKQIEAAKAFGAGFGAPGASSSGGTDFADPNRNRNPLPGSSDGGSPDPRDKALSFFN